MAPYRQQILKLPAPILSIPRNQLLSECGKPIDHMYFLLDGLVKIFTNNVNGYVRILGYHRKNTICAMDGYEAGLNAIVNVQSVTPVQVIPLTEEDLRQIEEREKGFLSALLRYYCRVLRLMCFDAENQSIGNTATRLANFICLYLQSEEYITKGYIGMSQDDLASAVNASRVQVSRVCSALRKAGVIDVAWKKVVIRDQQRLLEMASADMS